MEVKGLGVGVGVLRGPEQQLAVSLLRAWLTLVAVAAQDHPIGVFRDHQTFCDARPEWVSRLPEQLCGLGGGVEAVHHHRIGVGVVGDLHVQLVWPGEWPQIVAARYVLLDLARKVLRNPREQGPAPRLQPGFIARREPVLPRRPAHARRHVPPLRKAAGRGLVATRRRLPGKVNPLTALLRRLRLCLREMREAIRQHRLCQIGVLRQKRGEHPDFGIPEDMAFVKVSRECLRRNREAAIGPEALHEIEHQLMD